jgi:hypothetical protein
MTLQMFSGYHATPAMTGVCLVRGKSLVWCGIENAWRDAGAALERAGLDPHDLSGIRGLRGRPARELLHRIVAHFLRVRFPILLALNKADIADSYSKHVEVSVSVCGQASACP